jgi:hypothetical protein
VRSAVTVRRVLASVLLVLLLAPLGACGGASGAGVVVGSSAQTSKDYTYSGFTKVQVDQQFSVNVRRGKEFAVSVTVNDNLVQYLKVEVQGDTLHLGLDPSKKYTLADLTADITMPGLEAVTADGASDVNIDRFAAAGALALKVAGASKLTLTAVKAKDASLDMSGGSAMGGGITLTGDLDVKGSGASEAFLTGAARDLRLVVSGAGVVSLKRLKVQDAEVTLSGASQAGVYASGTIDLEASGASTFVYYGPGKLGKADVTGASQVNHITE